MSRRRERQANAKSSEDQPSSRRRDTAVSAEPPRQSLFDRAAIARISSGVGALALIIGILELLLQRVFTPLSLGALVIGLGGIALWTVLAPGDLQALISGRRALYGSNSLFTSILVLGIVAILYTLTANSGVGADLTQTGLYTLKNDIKTIVANISSPIQITAFYNTSQLDTQAIDTPILRMFSDGAPDRVKLAIVDPDAQPLLAKKFGLQGPSGIFISQLDAQGQPDMTHTVQMQGPFARESAIAESILQLQAKGKYTVLFTVGHSEIGTDIQAKEDAYGIRNGVEAVGIQTGTIDLRNEPIPRGTSAIVMLRPQVDLTQVEVDKIAKYMADGGKLLIMSSPAYVSAIQFMTSPDSPMSKYLWDSWGVRPQNDIVFDPDSNVSNPYRLLAAKVNNTSPITARDAAGTTRVRPMLTLAQSWELKPPGQAGNIDVTPLIYTSDKAVGKLDLPKVAANPDDPANLTSVAGDLKGPLLMAAAFENKDTNARLIVIGDADWIINDVVVTYDGQYLWTNMIDWLTRYLSSITVRPTIQQLPLIVDSASLNVVVLITLVLLPGVVLITGGLVWWDRSRRQ